MDTMRPLYAKGQDVILEVERVIGGLRQTLPLRLGPDLQNRVFKDLRRPGLGIHVFEEPRLPESTSTSTVEKITNVVKEYLDEAYPTLNVQPNEFNVCLLADQIGFDRRSLWPNPFENPVKYLPEPDSGFKIEVPQGNATSFEYVPVNIYELRFIYNESGRGRTAQQLIDEIAYMHQGITPNHIRLQEFTMRRIRIIINERIQKHPESEDDVWEAVQKEYGENEIKSVRHL